MIFQWINVTALFSLLGILLTKKLGAHFADQRKLLDEKIKSAGTEHENIRKRYEEIQSNVNALSSKIAELKSFSLKEIENETRRIEADASAVIEKMSADGEARLKNESERIKKNLEKELFQSALGLAKESLRKDMKSQSVDWGVQMAQEDADHGKKNYAS